jgi:hypothetical protein
VQFDLACDLWLNSEASESYVSAGDTTGLEPAIALYRGDFAEGFCDDWILSHRYRLENLYLEALARLTVGHEARGEYNGALAAALRLGEHDPLREDAHCVAMRAHYQLEQRGAALKQHGRCQAILEEELGIKPTSTTKELYQAILDGREVHAPERPAPAEIRFAMPIPLNDAPRHNLPAETTPFVGREEQLAELDQLLADPGIRLVTILGPGGIGKTRLAVESAGAQLDTYEHGVYLVPPTPLNDPASIVPTVTSTLDFRLYADQDPREQLFDYLREKEVLLLMDGFEHLVEGAGLLDDILHATPGVKVLATSRQKLNLSGETVFAIGGMDFPDWETPEDSVLSGPRYTEGRHTERRYSEGSLPTDAADPEGRTEHSAVKLCMQSALRARASF